MAPFDEGDWVKGILKIMKDEIPRFDKWHNPDPTKRRGDGPRLRGKAKTEFLAKSRSNDWFLSLLLACQDRSFFKAKRGPSMLPTKENVGKLTAAIDKVSKASTASAQPGPSIQTRPPRQRQPKSPGIPREGRPQPTPHRCRPPEPLHFGPAHRATQRPCAKV